MSERLGEMIKRLREARGWSQQTLATHSGLSRSHIASMEARKNTHPRADYLMKLAQVFDIPLRELYESVGYVSPLKKDKHMETHEEILERLKRAQPVSVPVYSEFRVHAGAAYELPVEHVYLERSRSARRNLEAYVVGGLCLAPEVRPGDIAIVDKGLAPQAGDIILCLTDSGPVSGRLEGRAGQLYLAGGKPRHRVADCQAPAVVIEVIRRLKNAE
jgi:transcriptional regulator with XRE-family HTH domain